MMAAASAPAAAPQAVRNGKRPLAVVLSLDVEEEGLFGGRYACTNPPVRNTAGLDRLAPLLERGARPTLFCAHSVLTDAASRRMLARLRDDHGAEIGAHLHHWNTPPLTPEAAAAGTLTRVPAAAVPQELLAAKLKTLFAAGADFQGAPLTSFRMGRWDAHARLWPLLAELGVRCDASVRPLHRGKDALSGPDHFDAPADPYWLGRGEGRLLEMPLTVTPLFSWLPGLARALPPGAAAAMRASLSQWGALALLPVQHPLSLLKLTTLLHAARGGQALSLTWHSSEMFPGGAPHMPDEAAVTRFLAKMCAYVDWLGECFAPRFLTLEELRRAAEAGELALARPGPGNGDWAWPGGAGASAAEPPRADMERAAPAPAAPAREARP
ncbi:glycosyl transferase family 1 [Desulfovibrio sp.]|uniref:glycosyl transferase family 1 n=1 Tax=Desulfovibrio sp. TaxID=885 RepID=UPI0023CB5BB1|nr:glycosyl transferase family 1 [Desulfovibrio sp.]MDE7241721.1 glycosyl transferase family 1 [Desulfovibrio sp.]